MAGVIKIIFSLVSFTYFALKHRYDLLDFGVGVSVGLGVYIKMVESGKPDGVW